SSVVQSWMRRIMLSRLKAGCQSGFMSAIEQCLELLRGREMRASAYSRQRQAPEAQIRNLLPSRDPSSAFGSSPAIDPAPSSPYEVEILRPLGAILVLLTGFDGRPLRSARIQIPVCFIHDRVKIEDARQRGSQPSQSPRP